MRVACLGAYYFIRTLSLSDCCTHYDDIFIIYLLKVLQHSQCHRTLYSITAFTQKKEHFIMLLSTIIKLAKGRGWIYLVGEICCCLRWQVTFMVIYNKWKMKTSNVYLRNEYYKDLSSSRFSSRTSRKIKSVAHRPDISDTKTRFQARIEKACTTFSNADVAKEMALYRREIQRLEKECLKKDKLILETRSTNTLNRELEAELVETYRIIYMYEGKAAQYEKQLKHLEATLAGKLPQELTRKVEELLESYRSENSELMGKVEESNRIVFELQAKLKQLENKYFSTAWKLSSTKREISNPLKKRFPNLRNTIMIKQTPFLEKQKALKNNMHSPRKQINQYQITEAKTLNSPQKQPIKFRRYQTKPQLQNTNQSMQTTANNKSSTELVHRPVQFIENKVSRQSPLRESKVYMSPISRYELNKKVSEVENLFNGHPQQVPRFISTPQYFQTTSTAYY